MNDPKIRIRQGRRQYRYLWLKNVTGIDLSRHCARSLHGAYDRHVSPEATDIEVTLTSSPHTLAWYLCGVTIHPYRWEENPHLALEAAPGHTEELGVQDLTVEISGLRPISFSEDCIDATHPHAHDREFRTCRNWQFAHHLKNEGVPDVRGNRPRGTTLRGVFGQLPLN
ncbi:hypothetical protein ACGFRG_05435 [Streptomyces sp. NPDC048696]|uniref:hypothetical protein n=1 Tax=Streptomyces sp. NPDC048696 TaxID=3365585 RepID=UPI003721FDB9